MGVVTNLWIFTKITPVVGTVTKIYSFLLALTIRKIWQSILRLSPEVVRMWLIFIIGRFGIGKKLTVIHL